IVLAESATASRHAADHAAPSALEQLGIGGQPEFRRTTGLPRRSSRLPLIAVGVAVLAAVALGLFIANKTRVGADLIAGGGSSASSSSTSDSIGKTSVTGASTSSTATTAPGDSGTNPHPDASRTHNTSKPAAHGDPST